MRFLNRKTLTNDIRTVITNKIIRGIVIKYNPSSFSIVSPLNLKINNCPSELNNSANGYIKIDPNKIVTTNKYID